MPKVKGTKTSKRRKVSFIFESPGSNKVALVGNFNSWDEKKHPMKNDGNGIWTKTVMLKPGKHEYKFFADNKWQQDPMNHRRVHNPFGTMNNIIEIE